MSLPRYPNYKDSGVEWLGEVPGHWEVARLSACAEILAGHSFDASLFGFDGVPVIRMSDFSEGAVQVDDAKRVDATKIPDKSLAQIGDVLLGLSGSISNFAIVRQEDLPIAINQRVAMVRIRSDHLCIVKWFLQSSEFTEQIAAELPETTIQNISMGQLRGCRLPSPPAEEQTKIANFLDRETAKIDELVAEQRRLMALLKEKRQAVISHAVTRGLNPNAPLKPSGIEWLGDVPEHWEVMPVRMISNVVRGASPRPAGDARFFGGDFMPWVTVGEITKDDAVYLTETEFYLTQDGAGHSNMFRSGTLIYSNSGATLGVPKILSIEACANDGVVALLNLNSKVQSEFLYHYLSSITESIREKVKQGSGQPNLNTDIVKELRFGIPPLEEQKNIVARITELANQFGSLTTEAQRAIDLLQERRSALISAAVTGQIDVSQMN